MSRRENPVCDAAELKRRIRRMADVVATMGSHYRPTEAWEVQSRLDVAYWHFGKIRADEVFQSLLQTYELPPKFRREVEEAAREFSRARAPKAKIGSGQAVAAQETWVKKLNGYVELAKRAMKEGTPSGVCAVANREILAGRFRLVNAGGFDASTMNTVRKIVEQASDKLEEHGLGSILYGDIAVSNTVSRQRVLAFYEPKTDEMFVRANVKGLEKETVRVVLHELGHRLLEKVVRPTSPSADRLLFARSSADEQDVKRQARRDALHVAPALGEEFEDGDNVYEVVSILPGPGMKVTVNMKLIRRRNKNGEMETVSPRDAHRAHISLEGFLKRRDGKRDSSPDGPNPKGFVTRYAATNARENFAELLSFYALDQLSDHQRKLLLDAMKGVPLARPSDISRTYSSRGRGSPT